MRLKKLELSGFKSFAKKTVLEFPTKIAAIVGPNGSGKSNIKESIQWVLGEQSMKSLRGKKGEDLIWNGSPSMPRTGKASVTLLFDNTDKKIPLEFEEVAIGRTIFRDGVNEYFINGSPSRLRDVVELMARIGLGETKHNIIGQGEVDHILLAGPRERRAMLEEALGLRVYQLKKNETERKLNATEQNMKQVEALLKEITPHLKFLRGQAEKAEKRGNVEEELHALERARFIKEHRVILDEKKKKELLLHPLLERQGRLKKEIADLQSEISEAQGEFGKKGLSRDDEKKIEGIRARRGEVEREIGRIEGRLEVEKRNQARPILRKTDQRYVEEEIARVLASMQSALDSIVTLDDAKNVIAQFKNDLLRLLENVRKGVAEEKTEGGASLLSDLAYSFASLQNELESITKELRVFEEERREERERFQKGQARIRDLDFRLRTKQNEERDVLLKLERLKFESEHEEKREVELLREAKNSGLEHTDIAEEIPEQYREMAPGEMQKKIEKMRARLEEIGGIDESVVKEFQETASRHEFLSGELVDLKEAVQSLKELMKELDGHIKKEFHEGFSKIKEEFNTYFHIIFSGGRAVLRTVYFEARIKNEEGEMDENEPEEGREGVEIDVDLPRKRIRGLAMLSGGERALTSIALLFAITAVNPPPFLILDETDAALDEANSLRYATILRELSKRTQLILVTHNRETMKSAGILYGVTMGSDGVSKLLSLKLEEAEEYTNR